MRPAVLLITACLAIAAAPAPRILVHGHRGARAQRPENTLPAFRYAIAQGTDVIELDVHVTKDNVLVVSHDPTLHRPICSGPRERAAIHELTLAEVRQWDCGSIQNPDFPAQQTVPGARIPTLDEVFRLAPKGRFDFNVEIKSDPRHPELSPAPGEFARMVTAKIRQYKLERRVIVQSFDYRTLVAVRQLAPEIRLSALTADKNGDFTTLAAQAGHAGIVSPYFQLVTPEKVEAAHKAGLQVVPWTPNTAAGWDSMIDAKVDAIITDDPAALIAHLKQRGLR
ncbi:MAG: glycerophosphodiester phosphodiesterase [Bryobacterales bacterium]|nr:glycerophosphodiester phosphodiesterase [Bryobacterales bacterium]